MDRRRGRKRKFLKAKGSDVCATSELPNRKILFKNRENPTNTSVEAAVTNLFEKRFEIVKDQRFVLPEAKFMFVEEPWIIDELQNLKRELIETKSKLNDYDLSEWSRYTKMRNKAGQVQQRLRRDVKPELATQAWCKFYENAASFPLVPPQSVNDGKLDSVHLCEAPGAFVASLNHWLRLNAPPIAWNWLATTLNPYYEGNSSSEMIDDDRLIAGKPENWFFGADGTGNIVELKNLDALLEKVADSRVTLVTADGSTDCSDTPGEQELVVSRLHFSEIVAALSLLRSGGNFLLKIFTIFEHSTVCSMYLLSCCFDRVVVNKPATSKEGNSEVYVVCLGFAGPDFIAPYVEILRRNYSNPSKMSMFRRNDIPERFIEQIVECARFFKEHQCRVILNNVETFASPTYEYRTDLDLTRIQRTVADRFVKKYKLRRLPSENLEIVGKSKLSRHANADALVDFQTQASDSYNSRRKRENLGANERLSVLCQDLDSISVTDIGNTYKFNDTWDNLWITTGKPYTKIESSKFCATYVLKVYNTVLEIIKDYPIKSTPTERATVFIREKCADYKIVDFEDDNKPDNHKLINKVRDALASVEKNQSLVFIDYSLLSQLSVGLLYLLSRTFESLEIKANENLGSIITLENDTKVEKITRDFENIVDASNEARKKGESILTVLPVSTIFDSPMYQDIVKINHCVIKHRVRRAADNFKEQIIED